MSRLTSFRRALGAQLAGDLGLELVPGKVEGPVERRDLMSVFPQGVDEAEGTLEQVFSVVVRVFKAWKPRAGVAQARDPEPLEDLAELLQETVANYQTKFGFWYCRVVRIEFDLDTYSFDATVSAWGENTGLS